MLLVAGLAMPTATGAATTERIVVDSLTGLAINGYDPVAYFAEAAAQPGRGSLELTYGGAVWRFDNEGNRAAFVRDPQVYMPRFGGHDPVALARGVALPGHPMIWLIRDGRLYLFHAEHSRREFEGDQGHVLSAAERGWQKVEPSLVP
jgi:hypothetical protein